MNRITLRFSRIAALFTVITCAASCGEKAPPPPAKPAAAPPPAPPPAPVDPAAPDSFRVRFETSKGAFVVEVKRAWAPRGADRFHNLVQQGFFNDERFFRVMPGFIVQFGMNGDTAVNAKWASQRFPDDPVLHSNKRGTVTFATQMVPGTRSSQLFVNLVDNAMLDAGGFSPVGAVVEGMKVVDAIYSGYGDVDIQTRIGQEGNAFLKKAFPKMDFIKTATVVGGK
jgi:peptidyl-prolyl cis-trans isomerase A (cyclophilin A)